MSNNIKILGIVVVFYMVIMTLWSTTNSLVEHRSSSFWFDNVQDKRVVDLFADRLVLD